MPLSVPMNRHQPARIRFEYQRQSQERFVMRSSRPDPVNPDSGAEQPARLVHPMLVALPVAFFVIDVADRVVAGKQAAAALFEISSTSTTGPARLVRMFG